MNRVDYLKEVEAQKDLAVRNVWYRHKVSGEYEKVVMLMELNDYEELKNDS